MNSMLDVWDELVARLRAAGEWLPGLALRMILAWEFYEAGSQKLHGSNWFSGIQEQFPFPFDSVPASFSWGMATWFELLGGIAILLGLFTRFFTISLMVLTVVAVAAVHWPGEWSGLGELWKGYAISDKGFGNYKLPLLYLIMFLPLLFNGPGKLSLDHLLAKVTGRGLVTPISDPASIGLAALAVGVPLVFVLPKFSMVIIALGIALTVWGWLSRTP